MNLEQTKQIFYHLSLQFLVDDMKSKSFGASAFHLGKQVPNFFFSGHLFSKVLALNEFPKQIRQFFKKANFSKKWPQVAADFLSARLSNSCQWLGLAENMLRALQVQANTH